MRFSRVFQLSLIIASALVIRGDDILTLVGPATRVLTESNGEVRFPLKIASVAPIQIIDVSLDGAPVPTTGFSGAIEPQGFLMIRIANDAAREAGTYTIVMRAVPPGGAQQLLTVTLAKPPIEVRFAAGGTTRLMRTFYWPGVSVTRPQSLTINTIGRHGTLVLWQRVWMGDLRNSDNVTVGQVRLHVPANTPVPGNAMVTIEVLGDPPLGSANATLRIAAPQLTGGAVDVPVEVVSKLASFWLFIVVFCGVVAGHFIRDVLERRRARSSALLTADEARRDLNDLLRSTVDAEDADKLRQIIVSLEDVMTSRSSSVDAIASAAQAAKAEAAKVIAATNDVRDRLFARIADWKNIVGDPSRQVTPIATELTNFFGAVEELEQQLAAGESRAVGEALARAETSLRSDLNDALAIWRAEVADGIARLETAVPGVVNTLAEARKRSEALASAEDVPAQVNAALELAAALRAGLRVGREAIARETMRALDRLSTSNVDSHRQIAEARELAKAVEWWSGDPAGEPLAALIASVEALCVAVLEAEESAAPVEKSLGLESFERRSQVEVTATEAVAPTPEPVVAIARIVVAGRAIAGRAIAFRLVSATRQSLPRIASVAWSVGNEPIQSTASMLFTYTPPVPKLLTVSADIEFEDRSHAAAEVTLQIAPAPDLHSAETVFRQGRLAEIIQTGAAAILITIAGMLIFRSAFVGNLENLVVAFLWGFGTDVGLAKVRELSQQVSAARK